MTKVQHDDLFIEWGRYDETARKAMLYEYQELRKKGNYDETFFEFLKQKLEIEGCWIKVG